MSDYRLMAEQIKALAEDDRYFLPVLSNASALIYDTVENLNWAGFYLVRDDCLVLGPFQGKVACIHIVSGKGVCGTAWAQDKTQLVGDVHQFPGHIACDGASRSEIVVPLHDPKTGKITGVLDIDSPVENRFSEEDKEGFELFAKALEESIIW